MTLKASKEDARKDMQQDSALFNAKEASAYQSCGARKCISGYHKHYFGALPLMHRRNYLIGLENDA
ncbi:hypothetical protein BV504_17560 [Halomonas sp. 'Soap Lake |nr:hypothetical protein B2G49_17715 [Halomonas sp. 'Soap Lake \